MIAVAATRAAQARLAVALVAPLALAATLALALVGASAAIADSSKSSNWAGYAIHRAGVSFTKAVGAWTQPIGTCTPGRSTYSSIWVGIGGYSRSSQALEQVGTELDCTRSGRPLSTAWYELVPAASRTSKLIVRPGDRVRATVIVSGRQVALTLADLTRRRSFTKTLRASVLDTSSAEWIVEAPSLCSGANVCQTLPLADFGSASISLAGVESTTRHTGTIEDRRWGVSKITLAEAGRRYIAAGSSSVARSGAVPSSLSAGGSAFTVDYRGLAGTTGPTLPAPAAAQVSAGRLIHPGR